MSLRRAPVLRLTLPLAPSINAYYRSIIVPARGGRPARAQPILSAEGNRYVANVSLVIARADTEGCPFVGPLRVELDVYMERRGSDVDNICKACLDALQASNVFLNDRQICDLHLRRYYDRKDPRIEVALYRETRKEMIDAIGKMPEA